MTIQYRKKTPASRLCSALAVALAVAGCGGGSPESMLASAKDYLAKNDVAAASIQLKNALAKKPDLAEARFLLGVSLLNGGDAASATVELQKALDYGYAREKLIPVLARALLAQGQAKKLIEQYASVATGTGSAAAELQTLLGEAYAVLGQFDKARASFESAVANDAGYAAAHLGLARLQAMSKDVPAALATVDGVLAKAPGNAEAWHFKAALLRVLDKTDEAIAADTKAVENNPRLLTAHAAIVMAQLQRQKLDLAAEQVAAMEKAAAKQPLTLYMQALLAYAKKDIPGARTAAEALLKVQPNSAIALQLRGILAFDGRSDLQAQEFLNKALNTAPGLDFGRRVLVLSYLRTAQPVKALATLKPVLHGSETDPAWFTLAGEVYMQNGEIQTAEGFFSQASKANPKDARNRTALALARMQLGRTEQALSDLEQIAATDAGVTADMALVSSALRQRQFDKALKAVVQLEKKQPDNPAVFNLRGNILAARGDLKGAREEFSRSLGLNAAFFPAAASLAKIDLMEKRPDDARQRFEAVLKKEPKNTQASLAIVELRASAGAKTDELTDLLTKAIAGAPDDPAPRLALINLHLATKDNSKAVAAAQEALAAIPDRPEVLDLAARVMQQAGNTNQALAYYGKLATLLPSAPQPHLRMAEVHLAAKNIDAARSSLTAGLAAKPDSVPLHRAMIMLDVNAGHYAEALKRAHELQKTHATDIIGYALAGDVHAAKKAWTEAADAYRSGLKVNAKSTELAQRLIMALSAGGQESESRRVSEAWLKANPKDSKFRGFLADTANRSKDYAAAAGHYRVLLVEQPRNPAVLNNLAWTLGQLRDPKALGYAEEANRIAPDQANIMDTLGVLLVEKGDLEPGLAMLRKAIELAPQMADIRLNLAKALLKANKKTEARQELEALVKLGDKFADQAAVGKLLQSL